MRVKRLGPVIDATTAGYDPQVHDNINGPSLIRVPDWVENPLGRYYLYFAHHRDDHIRMAYADALIGPYTIYPGGVLSLAHSRFIDHIASPDVHVVDGLIRLYYHGFLTEAEVDFAKHGLDFAEQRTRLATSRDGLRFEEHPQVITAAYLRVFRFRDRYYGIAAPGILYRSSDGLTGFERGPIILGGEAVSADGKLSPTLSFPRHLAVQVIGDRIRLFYSLAPDTPESIYMSEVHAPDNDWATWKLAPAQRILTPEMDYEGGDLPVETSKRGVVMGRVRQLRDPAIYEEDGRTYLLYSTAGESGIAIAELLEDDAGAG